MKESVYSSLVFTLKGRVSVPILRHRANAASANAQSHASAALITVVHATAAYSQIRVHVALADGPHADG